MFKYYLYSVASILLSLSSLCSAGGTPIEIPFSDSHIQIDRHLLVRTDTSYNSKELADFVVSDGWTPYDRRTTHNHERKKPIWLKVDLTTSSQRHDHNVLLVIESSYIDKIDIILVENGVSVIRRSAGSNIPYEQRSIKNRYILQPLTLKPTHSYSLLIKTNGAFVDELIRTTAIWVPEDYYLTKHTQQTLNFGWQAGVLGILALLHAIAVFTYRKSLWVYSFTFIFSALAILALRDGYVFTLLNVGASKWSYKGIWAFTLIHAVAAIMMSRRILCRPADGPSTCSRVLMASVILNLLAIPPILSTTYEGVSQIGNILSAFNLIVFTLLLGFAALQMKRKKPGLGGFLVVWGVFTFTCWATSPFFHHGLNALPIHASNMIVFSIVAISIWLYLYAVGSTLRKHHSLQDTQHHIASHLRFISHLTNEIRAALNGVVGTADVLRGQLPPEKQDLVSTIQRAGRRLHHLTNNVQDFTILGQYSVNSESSPFQIDRLLSRMANESRGVRINLQYANNTIFNLVGDATRWVHTFDTLMDCSTSTKSIKSIDIKVGIEDVLDHHTAVITIQWLALSNTDYSPKLLEISSLDAIAQNHNEQNSYGLQLALFLCKTFVESMSGSFEVNYCGNERSLSFEIKCRVSIDSPEHQRFRQELKTIQDHHVVFLNDVPRNTFSYVAEKLSISPIDNEGDVYLINGEGLANHEINALVGDLEDPVIVLNFDRNEAWQLENVTLVSSTASIRDTISTIAHALSDKNNAPASMQLKALVVEDDNVCRQIIIAILEERLSIAVDFATDGLRGLEMSTKKKYDFIFIDCVLPLLNGVALTKQIRDPSNLNSDTPIIAVTAHRKNDIEDELFAAGTSDVIYKPIDTNTMADLIDRISK